MKQKRGFTLIALAIVTAIIGILVVAVLELLPANSTEASKDTAPVAVSVQ